MPKKGREVLLVDSEKEAEEIMEYMKKRCRECGLVTVSEFKLKVIYPKGIYFEDTVEICNVRTVEGQMGILANRLPFAGVLDIAEMNFVKKGERSHYFVGAAVASIMNASLPREILWLSVTGRITEPTVRQLK